MKAKIYITLKQGVLDPQGQATQVALGHLGFDTITNVRQGKLVELDLTEKDTKKAEAIVEGICQKLLANTVIENYKFELTPVK
jgi:phosphoribosylformylglycinamidine synthase subunit PurS